MNGITKLGPVNNDLRKVSKIKISKDENYIPDTIKELGGYENVIS